MRTKHDREPCNGTVAHRSASRSLTDAVRHVECSEHVEPATDPVSIAAREECRDAMREMPAHLMLPKRAVLELMQEAFRRGASWHQEAAGTTLRGAPASRSSGEAMCELLDEIRDWLTSKGWIEGVHYDDESIVARIDEVCRSQDVHAATGEGMSEALEISLIRPPGRGDVHLRTSSEHPGMLVVIGLEGLPHGALIGLDADNRSRLRHWLDMQESAP